MPYVDELNRNKLDECINDLVLCLKNTVTDKPFEATELNNIEVLNVAGNINYVFSRICAGLMGSPSYSKIAVITGVLENIKQEFYRRVAERYEDKKILENGDIREYKLLK